MSKVQWSEAVQDVLNRAFKDSGLTSEDVRRMDIRAQTMDFPRSFYCKCKRCTSPYRETSVLRYYVTLATTTGEHYGWLPGPEDAFAHPMEDNR